MIAGGVDTYRDEFILQALDAEGRVRSETSTDGFIPGEGAAFVLLASPRAAATYGLAPIARFSRAALGFEPGHLYSEEPYRGTGLAATLAQLRTVGTTEGPLEEVYSSMNGESHWAKEWGVSYTRNHSAFSPAHGVHHPAECCGDTGAACGPLMLGLAALGIRGGYRRSPAVVYASSDRGQRAAVVVAAPIH
jgi:3-oxoacyl-[acyl-carrier-protein] synthase-1